MLSEYQYNILAKQVTLFEQLSKTPKRPHVHHKRRISSGEYQEVTMNITGRGHVHSDSSRYDTMGELRWHRVDYHARNRDSRLSPPDYARVNTEAFEANFTIAVSSASNFGEGPSTVNMAGMFEE